MNKVFLKDFSWYFLASVIPIILGLAKVGVFTRHYSVADYGVLGIVSVSFSFIGVILYSWISSCIWRFYENYKNNNRLKFLFGNLTLLFGASFVITFVIVVGWSVLDVRNIVQKLILFSFLHLVFSQIFSFYMIVVRIEGNSKFYSVFQIIRSIIAFLLLLYFAFMLDVDISAMISSLMIVEILSFLVLLILNPLKLKLKSFKMDINSLKDIGSYAITGLFIHVCVLLITLSDRYIIALTGRIEEVGIYDQIYKISQLSISAIVTVYFNTVNPSLIKLFEKGTDTSILKIRNYIKIFCVIGIPIVLYLSFFSKEISALFLGPKFRIAYDIMPVVFFVVILTGLTNFYELRFKFTNKLRKLNVFFSVGVVFNLITTFFAVQYFGYKSAAVTTLGTYILVLSLFLIGDKNFINLDKKNIQYFLKYVLFLSGQIVCYFFVIDLFEFRIVAKCILVLLFALSYFFLYRKDISLILKLK